MLQPWEKSTPQNHASCAQPAAHCPFGLLLVPGKLQCRGLPERPPSPGTRRNAALSLPLEAAPASLRQLERGSVTPVPRRWRQDPCSADGDVLCSLPSVLTGPQLGPLTVVLPSPWLSSSTHHPLCHLLALLAPEGRFSSVLLLEAPPRGSQRDVPHPGCHLPGP